MGQNKAKTVGLCITELDVGGAERCLFDLATRLDPEHFRPVVYCLGPRPEDGPASFVPPLEAAGIEVHCLGGSHISQFPQVLFRLRRLVRLHRIDLLQTFMFHANITGRLAAAGKNGPPVVCGIHVAEHSCRWHLWLDRLTSPLVSSNVCVSRSVAEFTRRMIKYPESKLVVIQNRIDPTLYPAKSRADLTRFGIAPHRKVMTFVGRLAHQKGIDWLLHMAPEWMQSLPDWDLLLVGDGPLNAAFRNQVESTGLSDRVFFAGWRPDVDEILAASDLMVLPSRWEGMPIVLLQAMASGLPVLATDVEGVRELLGPLGHEQSVAHDDTPAWLDRLHQIANDPELAARLGNENRRRVEEHFSIDISVRQYESLWTEILEPCQ